MDRKELMRWLGVIALCACALAVMAFSISAARRSRLSLTEEADTQKTDTDRLEGLLANAYIETGDGEALTVWYEGEQFFMDGALSASYTGVADLVIRDGELVMVNAKPEFIEGTLDSYTDATVQISGYEVLNYADELPVYVVFADEQEGDDKERKADAVRQKKLEDLVVGTSRVRLVVAYGEACALIQYSEDYYEKIRVLIKNKTALTYDELYLTSDSVCRAGDETLEAGTVISARKWFKDSSVGEELRVSTENGRLYLCDKKGSISGDGYEGDFLVRKAESGYVLINELPIETYLCYVVPSEMPTYFSYEALKAQAVCARTFAYQQMQGNTYAAYGANLDDSTSFQVYHAAGVYEITSRAVADTQGLVLKYDGELIVCYYYSTGSGYSENLEVWNAESPDYLVAENRTAEAGQDLSDEKRFHAFILKTPDSYDAASPYYRWTAELSAGMGMDAQYGKLRRLVVNKRSPSGYILSLTAVYEGGERTYDRENEIRFALSKYITKITLADGSVHTGFGSLPSACFEVTSQKNGNFTLTGGGFGHGIGMSQYGADGMGREGKSWQEILAYYYKGAEIVMKYDAL